MRNLRMLRACGRDSLATGPLPGLWRPSTMAVKINMDLLGPKWGLILIFMTERTFGS